ncbi:glutaredoxin family protein [Tessaracoccus flavus]|uniref:glutaredoxin family protein n=1 Tax=Tessaracoccus flavus TaxID=1610493 RepID=UPI00089A65BE|nr:glutaredoxin family protein [Tessaracoccus flavus]SDZ02571.1 Glutaredoxin [Tessaracoccus flavus]
MTPPSRVVLLTRAGCHLCVEAEATLRRTCEDLGVAWRALDIDSEPDLRAGFTDHVPVTFVDRQLLSYWFLDEDALRAALSQPAPLPTHDEWVPTVDLQP